MQPYLQSGRTVQKTFVNFRDAFSFERSAAVEASDGMSNTSGRMVLMENGRNRAKPVNQSMPFISQCTGKGSSACTTATHNV